MKTKTITLRSSPEAILRHFRDCTNRESVNLKTKDGFVYLVGGILNKLDETGHYIAINGRWVLV